jgi:cell division septal protein FtsQ
MIFSESGDQKISPSSQIIERIRLYLYDKEILISGNFLLSKEEVMLLLPMHDSNIWWKFNKQVVKNTLLKNPLIVDATLKSCEWSFFSCYDISIVEAEPRYLILNEAALQSSNEKNIQKGQKAREISGATLAWLVRIDGTYISPIDDKDEYVKLLETIEREENPSLVLLKGIIDDVFSSDRVKGKLMYISDALNVIESEISLKVKMLSMGERGEIKVVFKEYPFSVVFEYASNDFSVLAKEANRLKMLLPQFKGTEHTIEEIDLAFDKVGVVRLKEASKENDTEKEKR